MSFSDEEKEQLRKISNRSYLLDKTSRYHTWLSLVDILLAYSYEVRSTEGEHNVSVEASPHSHQLQFKAEVYINIRRNIFF